MVCLKWGILGCLVKTLNHLSIIAVGSNPARDFEFFLYLFLAGLYGEIGPPVSVVG
jgi:hypothetical protein